MKRIGTVLLMGVALAWAQPAIANQIQVGYPGSAYGPYQTGEGGEFTFSVINPEEWLDLSGYAPTTSDLAPTGIASFQTFCIEFDEYIYPYDTTYNAQLSTTAMQGGMGSAGDPISVGTGWLYSQFAQGILAGYDYTPAGRSASADALQQAIWWLEGEGDVTFTNANMFMVAVVNQFGSQAAAEADGGWTYGVYAVNLWSGSDPTQNRAQDGLYYGVPDGGTTLALLGMALCAVSVVSRRFRRA